MTNIEHTINLIDNCRSLKALADLDDMFRILNNLDLELSNLDLALEADRQQNVFVSRVQNRIAMKFLELEDINAFKTYRFEFHKTNLDVEVYINGRFWFVLDDLLLNLKTVEDYYYYLKETLVLFKDELRQS